MCQNLHFSEIFEESTCTQKFEKQRKIYVCWGQSSKELCPETGLKKSECRLVFILLSTFYSHFPRTEDDLTDWWHWDNGHCWRMELLWAPFWPALGEGGSYPLYMPPPGHGRTESSSPLERGSQQLSPVLPVGHSSTLKGKNILNHRPRSGSPIWLSRNRNRILIFFSVLFLNQFRTFKRRIWLISPLKLQQNWLLENSEANVQNRKKAFL